MGRAERRKAQRQERRVAQRTAGATPSAPAFLPEVGGAPLVLPGRRNQAPGAGGSAAGPPTARPSVGAAVRRPSRAMAAKQSVVVTASSLEVTNVGCEVVEDLEPAAIGMTYGFEAWADGVPRPVTIRFDGRREREGDDEQVGADRFSVTETVDVVPGSGHITVTARADVAPGRWAVTARPADPEGSIGIVNGVRSRPATARSEGRTAYAPLVRVRAPGVRIGAWPALVATGAGLALTVQALLAAELGLPSSSVLVLSAIACLVGLVGAKFYFLVEHPTQRRRGLMAMTGGMCIQGFVLAAVATVVVGSLLVGLPVGGVLDATAPGLLLGMSVGRVGCFLGGCCAGRPTRSRWGMWSSDRRLGVRRIPTQLLESTLALLLGGATLAVVLATEPRFGGLVFVGALAAYTLGRQSLFPLRNLPRHTSHGRAVVSTICLLVLVGAVVLAVA